MKIVFLDSKTLGADVDLGCFSRLGEAVLYASSTPETVPQRIADAEVVITNKVKLTPQLLAAAKKLQLVCVTATGYDNVDMAYARAHGIGVCNVRDYSTDSVVQLTVSLVLALVSHLPVYDRYCKSGAYTASGIQNCLDPVFYELAGKTWGVYGYGSIGKRVAHIAEAFGCKVLACKRTPSQDVRTVSLHELFEQSDIVSLHTPLTPETFHSVNAEILNTAKKHPILVNVARGAVTDEQAVASAVENGLLGGFAADVYSTEPMPADSPLARLVGRDNVIFTPHMAWGAYEARLRLVNEVCRNIQDFLAGGRRNRVDL